MRRRDSSSSPAMGRSWPRPFDLAEGRIRGEPVPLAEAFAVDASFYLAGLSAAADGTLAIRPPPAALVSSATAGAFDGELTFIRRDGSVSSRFGGVQKFFEDMAMSPDAKAVAALVQDTRTSGSELWRVDVDSGTSTPLTSMRTSGGYVGAPVWSPDGTRVAFACQPPGILDDVCVRDSRSGVVTTPIQSKDSWEHPLAWSPDGQYMIVAFNAFPASSREELRVWSESTKTLSPFVASGNDAAFSPDGRFVVFIFARQRPGRSVHDDVSGTAADMADHKRGRLCDELERRRERIARGHDDRAHRRVPNHGRRILLGRRAPDTRAEHRLRREIRARLADHCVP